MSQPRYVVVGAGAVGGAAAVLLQRSGASVRVVARGAHRDAVANRGLTLRTPASELEAKLDVLAPDELVIDADRDVVIVAVKSQDTRAALDDIVHAGGIGATLVCAQNGVENERACARISDRVVAAMVWTPAVFSSPGVIECYAQPAPAMWLVGAWPHGLSPEVERLASDLDRAGIAARAVADVMRYKYAKLLDNLGNSVDALCAANLEAPDWRAVLEELRTEGEACLRAANIEWASPDEMEALRDGRIAETAIAGRARPGGSTWQSLTRGAALELDYLNGEICLLGIQHGVATPHNRALLKLAAQQLRARRPARSATLQDLRDHLEL